MSAELRTQFSRLVSFVSGDSEAMRQVDSAEPAILSEGYEGNGEAAMTMTFGPAGSIACFGRKVDGGFVTQARAHLDFRGSDIILIGDVTVEPEVCPEHLSRQMAGIAARLQA